ncbi:MAG: hypothetical protein OEU09_00215 [Rhodospirillales bacterium]|nr:hypothetical protein [Rhodospirillales bacterium]MDH3909685.1 hypothetical protein [Rhodospirillales bacterium]MDH3965767.1 hypothetical protein [Rhodospirillales bacterium]
MPRLHEPSPRAATPATRTLAWLPVAAVVWADAGLGQEDPKDIIAAAVRQRGHDCTEPESARPDPDNSSRDQKAWILRCENATFRVKYIGDRGAEVEPIGE